ncbi:MAG: hypothetical protein HZC36_11965 [Armatimonadetes bacterium]|nr:hypothetical protein [Armatimonadota bacterium]
MSKLRAAGVGTPVDNDESCSVAPSAMLQGKLYESLSAASIEVATSTEHEEKDDNQDDQLG